MKLSLLLVSALSAAVLMAGCGKHNNGVDTSPIDNARQAAKAPEVQGVWESAVCKGKADSAIAGAVYNITEHIEFSGDNVRRITYFYTNTACQKPAAFEVEEKGTFDAGDDMGNGLKTLNMQFQSAVITVHDKTTLLAFNTLHYGNIQNWVLDQPSDVTASSDGGTANWRKLPRTVNNIYKIEGNRLMMGVGNDADMPDPTRRPTAVDTAYFLTKQG
jgi:hypothetical protein